MASKREVPVDDSPSTSYQPEKKARRSARSDQHHDESAELPILRLNHDCLLKIMGYLNLRDLLNFSLLNSRIANVLEENACRLVGSEIILHNNFRQFYPRSIYGRLFRMISPSIESVEIRIRNQQNLRDFLKDFTHIKEAHVLDNMDLKSAAAALPPLVKLNLEQGKYDATVLEQLFTRMSPTLRKLCVGSEIAKRLMYNASVMKTLRGLESIKVPAFTGKALERLIEQNPKLTKLSLIVNDSLSGYYVEFIDLNKCINIKKLKFIGSDYYISSTELSKKRLPNLEILVIKNTWRKTCIAPLKDMGPQLKTIKIGKDVIDVGQQGTALCPKYCQACQYKDRTSQITRMWYDTDSSDDYDDSLDGYASDSSIDPPPGILVPYRRYNRYYLDEYDSSDDYYW